ncbi:S-layer homology domain-containing protein [Clostridium sp. MD294]|uniref:S-layer homology domain-containing protein n=1 Tax=Clostridium sp. MD294 TaxID=97138 RepID=UPI0002CBF860|nr:S-layer homology domain-containing protein [Clostridium sp. MD294]NDO47432.1 S-layer homology domain-containing protein [Clostridium sp. MD294]USF29497.1 hypothetical protein C820_000888 [Clostridium sp. MD294]
MKQKIAVLLVACVLSTNFYITSYGASFSDINNVPWPGAVTYINTVSDLGLMVGDIDAKTGKSMFRAKDHVTYCETTQLAYALLKKTGKLKHINSDTVSRWTQVMQGYNIPAWAYESVSYALENNIISLTDTSRFVTKKNGVVTNNYASRESVAVIFGKFLSHLYTVNANATLTFNDKGSIASTSVPYVDLLARLNIMVGDTDSNFTPKAAINRAETAVLVSKTYDVLNSNTPITQPDTNNIISGTITSLEQNGNNKLIAITTAKGDKQGFIVDNTTTIYQGDTTKTINLSMLEIGDGVSIEYESSKAKVIRLVNDVVPSTLEVKGSIDDVTSSKITLVKSDKSTESYYFAKDFDITLDKKDISQKDLLDEFDEYVLDAILTLDGSGNIIAVDVTKGKETGVTGILVSISEDELSVKESKNSKTKDFEWVSNPDIYLEGKESTVSRVRKKLNDETLYAKYYLDSKDRVKKVMVSEDEFGEADTKSTITGTISSIDEDSVKIRKRSDGKREEFDFASKIKYYLDGDSCSFRDVEKAFNKEDDKTDPADFYIKVYLDDDGDVKELYASLSSKNLEGKEKYETIDGKVLRMSEDEIRVEEDNEKAKNYDIARNADYYIENNKSEFEISTYTKVKKAYDEACDDDDDFFVTLYLDDDDEVIKIEASPERDSYGREVTGTITKLSKNSVTLKDKSSYDMDNVDDIKMYLNDSKVKKLETLEDLVNDRDITLKAVLTIESGEVTQIDAYYYEVKGELLSVDGKAMEVKTTDDTTIEDIEVLRTSIDVTGDYTSFRDMTAALRTENITVTLECSDDEDDRGKVIKITAKND